MSDWTRMTNTTISNYLKGEEVNILRNRKVPAVLKERGRITYNWDGLDMVWRIRYRRHPMQGYADNETLTFPRRDRWKTATLPWRGYTMTDSMTKLETLKNRGQAKIIDVYAQIAESIMDDMQESFGDEFYVDGNATGNSRRFHGIESFMGTSGAYAGGFVGAPSDSYANLNTDLGSYGGSWSGTTWPTGTGDSHYDFWSPLIVDYTATNWQAGTKTWPGTCIEALRYGIIKSQKNKTKKGKLDMIILNDDLYYQWLMRLDDKQRILIQSNASNSTLLKLGFTDVQNMDGVDITYEYGTPINLGYGFNIDQLELRSMQDQLWKNDGPEWDIASRSYRFAVDCFANLVFNPRYFIKFKNIS